MSARKQARKSVVKRSSPWRFKLLLPGRRAYYGRGRWPKVGTWTPVRRTRLCQSGWHLTNRRSVHEWANRVSTTEGGAVELYLAEGRGQPGDVSTRTNVKDDKAVFKQARLVALIGTLTPRQIVNPSCYNKSQAIPGGTHSTCLTTGVPKTNIDKAIRRFNAERRRQQQRRKQARPTSSRRKS